MVGLGRLRVVLLVLGLGLIVVAITSSSGGLELDHAAADGTIESPDSVTVPDSPIETLVILFNFQNVSSQPITLDEARSLVFTGANSPNVYLQEVSGGTMSLTGRDRSDGDVVGWYSIAATNEACDHGALGTWEEQANAEAQADGIAVESYDRRIYMYPSTEGCSLTKGGDPSVFIPVDDQQSGAVITHEIGHTFGLGHASSYVCTDADGSPQAISDTCVAWEYGDPFDPMGHANRHFHNIHKAFLGILPIADTVTVSSPGTYTYTLSPSEEYLPGTVQVLRVPRAASRGTFLGFCCEGRDYALDYYYMEFRQPYGSFDDFSAEDEVVNGVTIRIAGDFPSVVFGTFLIDTVPGGGFEDAPLTTGRTFSDPVAGVSISVLGVSPTGAIVEVTLEQSPPPTGDADCDGITTTKDANLITEFSAGLLGAVPCLENADVYEDGIVDVVDSSFILQHLDAFIIGLPVEPDAGTHVSCSTFCPPVAVSDLGLNVGDEGVSIVAVNGPPHGLGAWTLDLAYDPSLVEPTTCVPQYGVCNVDFASDTVRLVGAYSSFEIPFDWPLAEITFQCLTPGSGSLVPTIQVLRGFDGEITFDAVIDPGSVSCIGSEPTQAPTATPAAGLGVHIGSLLLDVGDLGSLELSATGLAPPGLGAWTVDISFDPVTVSAVQCTSEIPSFCGADYGPDTVRVSSAVSPGLLGDVTLANIVFACDAVGSAVLTLSLEVFADDTLGDPQDIDAQTFDGMITCSPAPATPTPTPPGVPGDVNCDISVNAIDALFVLQFVAALVSALDCEENADVDGSGSLSAIDAALILQFTAGFITAL